jgi:hypothetical protein
VAVCEPTWNVMPSSFDACRAFTSSRAAFAPEMPYFRSSGILLFFGATATRTQRASSRQPPVSSRILRSSSSLSSAKLRTPNSANARRIAVRDFTGCMKCRLTSGMVAASSISGIEATSKCRMPAPYSAPSRNTELLAL